MNLHLILAAVVGVVVLGSIAARRVEREWRKEVEVQLASCTARADGMAAALDAALAAADSADPVGELRRRFGR